MRRDLVTSLLAVVAITVVFGLAYPARRHRHLAGRLPRARQRLADRARRQASLGSRPVLGRRQGLSTRPYPALLPAAALDRHRATTRPRRPSPTSGPTARTRATTFAAQRSRGYLRARAALRPRPDARAGVPVDAVTSSASGVDPHISQANAAIQAHRIAAVRRLPLARVQQLIADNTDGRSLGVLGEPGRQRPRAQPRPRPGSLPMTAPQSPSTAAHPSSAARRSLMDRSILVPAVIDSLRKLDPRVQVRNPVMFVVEIGARDHHGRLADPALRRRPLGGGQRAGLVHVHGHGLAVADRRLRQPRRGARRGPRPRAGRQRCARCAPRRSRALRDGGDEAGVRARSAATSWSSRPAR